MSQGNEQGNAEGAHQAHQARKHAACSASAASRWLSCPGSLGLSREVPAPPPSAYAAEGTRCHELAERLVLEWLARGRKELPEEWVESLRPQYADTVEDGPGPGGDCSMVDHALTYLNVCRDAVAAFDEPEKVSAKPEVRLTLDEEMSMFGTVDFLATGTVKGVPTGVLVDLKYGRGVRVHAEGNAQLAYYAVALRKCSKKALKRVKVVIVQPRIEEWLTEAWFEVEDLDHWHGILTRGAQRALQQLLFKKYELVPGEAQCRFCPAKGACSAHARWVSERAALDFSDGREGETALTVTGDVLPALTPEKVSRILSAREEVKRFIDAVEEHAVALMLSGKEVPGFKLVEGRTQRRWAVPDQGELAEALRARGVRDPYDGPRLRSVASVERELTYGAIADLVSRPKGQPSVAAVDDPRPEYQSVPGVEFATEEGE